MLLFRNKSFLNCLKVKIDSLFGVLFLDLSLLFKFLEILSLKGSSVPEFKILVLLLSLVLFLFRV